MGRVCLLIVLSTMTLVWPRGTLAAEGDIERLEQAVVANPASIAARLELGLAYAEAGRLADAKLIFRTVLHFTNLPSDLESQVSLYVRAAHEYFGKGGQEGGQLAHFEYVEAGVGGYKVTSSSDAGGSEPSELFYLADLRGGLNYELRDGYALGGSLRYEARLFDSNDTRNDSDLHASLGVSRAIGDSNIAFDLRGRLTYIGDSDYRHDYGASLDWTRQLDTENEIVVGAFIRRRQYPAGPLRDRSRTIAEAQVEWIRSLLEGRASLLLGARGGYQYATRREDGNSALYGATAAFDYAFTERLSGEIFVDWEHNRFNADQLHFHPDSLDEANVLRRRDNLYEVATSLTWEFASSWVLHPAVVYLRDKSNLDDFHYGSIEFWMSVRKLF